MTKAKKLKHNLKHKKKLLTNLRGISEEDFEKADKILKAIAKVPPPKKTKK